MTTIKTTELRFADLDDVYDLAGRLAFAFVIDEDDALLFAGYALTGKNPSVAIMDAYKAKRLDSAATAIGIYRFLRDEVGGF